MKINRVCIENFRSIQTLEFFPTDICALVGENNAGKTNLLAALDFLLGESWPTRKGLDTTDYYNQDTTRPICIEIGFASNNQDIKRIWCTIPWDGQGETRVEYESGKTYNLNNAIRERCALVYLDANRNLEYHLGQSRWTLFGRIIRQLDEDFRTHAPQDQKDALIQSFNQARNLLQTELYQTFESTFSNAFGEQIKRTLFQIEIEFQTFDPLNYYRSIRPLLREHGISKNPTEAGQGMRNLILLALFRTYAKVFKGDAIIGIEEPEIYLHPHAQRSLAALFDELAKQGNQIFYSTHNGNFIDIEHFDRIGLVEKRSVGRNPMSTQVCQVSANQLLQERQRLYPNVLMSIPGLRERYRNICNLEHNEAFFARKIVLVEGETEEYALPIYAHAVGYDLDANGISVVNAHGKNNLDSLYQLYTTFGIPVYLIFDNDRGGEDSDLKQNEVLLKLLDRVPSKEPPAEITESFAILEGQFEKEMFAYLESVKPGKYRELENVASEVLGSKSGKGLKARFMAQQLIKDNLIPDFIKNSLNGIQHLGDMKIVDDPSQMVEIPEDLPF